MLQSLKSRPLVSSSNLVCSTSSDSRLCRLNVHLANSLLVHEPVCNKQFQHWMVKGRVQISSNLVHMRSSKHIYTHK
ncbi:unnamed protein product [Musa textilis]